MIATLYKREDRVCHRRRTARIERTAGAAFQFAHRFLKREVGISAATTIKQLTVCAIGGGEFFVLHGIKHQRRGALDNRVYRALGIAFIASGDDQLGFEFH
ncbi:hypothetical protein SDC9_212755 [bioreactor metagenome]|uniref:Uncharacterized protein n=1 Tax=bioreactor metagenome TaxID=1076179 RepID=A0A645JNM4_9ZZZZ